VINLAIEAQRAAAYVRESTEEQGQGFSPDAQRQAIKKFAEENELALIGEYCDFQSGWRKSEGRPEFQRLMADAAKKRFDVVLVYHTSRFARNQVEARRYKQLLRERLGIRVVSVTQPMGEDHTDPSAFLAESIHEMFDEYYSVSLSFWTRSGLKEKARQGPLVGSLPWGYVRDQETKIAIPDPDRAPLIAAMFERYATGTESDRSIAAWLNAKGVRTARDRPFGKDTVREMLCNAAYAGYVSGLRDKSRSIKGLHKPLVSDELFDRVQEVRSWRTTILKPSRPSEDYLLRKLLYCERCGARMHGTRGSRGNVRRYQCSTRRYHGSCDQTIVPAQPLEEQLVGWLRLFQPDAQLRGLILDAIRTQAGVAPDDAGNRRRALTGQLDRLRELYVMGDLPKAQYVMRRQALEEELQRTASPADPGIERASALLDDFAAFWQAESHPGERYKLLMSLFAQVWAKDTTVVAVKPHAAFAPYFAAISEARKKTPKAAPKSGVTKAGATGLEPATSAVTGQRSNRLSYAPGGHANTSAAFRPTSMPSVLPGRRAKTPRGRPNRGLASRPVLL
jgi:DNA invertase Pin-like site-specific DNA recombinase